ncbi:MAG: class I SAM-dependent methyltransferase [Mycobacterium sp.]|nr:class I SAM-dependent methyltransferase [Mycobacterium sp.]MBV9351773.1 class I SAM-dependent methyltransferase [Mycobacterium sp.]
MNQGAAEITDTDLRPHFEDVQSHYDLSDDFYRLFLDPSQTYSCAYFERDDMTLEEAQLAKIDLALGKLGLQPGMTLLDVGCGWGATLRRAIDRYDVNAIGLTLSKNQAAHVQKSFDEMSSPRSKEVRLQGWEQFHEPVDRIVSIGAFEHFGFDRYHDFFATAYQTLPADGVMLLHTIVNASAEEVAQRGLKVTMSLLRFVKFIMKEIFPGGRLPSVALVEEYATRAGFEVARVQPLRLHYARTLDSWAASLRANKDQAIAIQSEEVYERYVKYLTGCADLFRTGFTDVCQFTLVKGAA